MEVQDSNKAKQLFENEVKNLKNQISNLKKSYGDDLDKKLQEIDHYFKEAEKYK